jgi:hypothetical protein
MDPSFGRSEFGGGMSWHVTTDETRVLAPNCTVHSDILCVLLKDRRMGLDSPALRPSVLRMFPFLSICLLDVLVIIPVAHERMNCCSFVDRDRWAVSSLNGVYVVLADMDGCCGLWS